MRSTSVALDWETCVRKNRPADLTLFSCLAFFFTFDLSSVPCLSHTPHYTQFIHRRFTNAYKATIGADFITKEIELEDGKRVSLQIWDTAGMRKNMKTGQEATDMEGMNTGY